MSRYTTMPTSEYASHVLKGETPMAWIQTVANDRADGLLKKMYDAAVERVGKVFNIVRVMSLHPRAMRDSMAFYRTIMLGDSPLSRAQRELLATVTSRINACDY